MKLNFYFRYSLIITMILLIVIPSCKSKKDILFDKGDYLFENQTDDCTYFIKIDFVDKNYVVGNFYFIDDSIVMEAEPLTVIFNKKKCTVISNDTILFSYKVKNKSSEMYGGWFKNVSSSEKKMFVLYKYITDDYQAFENRYKDEIFEVERISDINYAKTKGFWSSVPDDSIDVTDIVKTGLLNSLKRKELDLDMDIYVPKNDTLSKRPLMMFIHGGAFYIGDKATIPYQKLCSHFASLGYVCVSINYRMGFRINSKAIERTAYQATQDAHAAMRYLVSKKDIYRIDTDNLYVGGASAGSITAMNLTYMRNKNRLQSSYSSFLNEDLGDLETSGNKIYNKFKIKAVANMWGAINDLEILNNSKASIISFHGDKDDIVPYDFDYPFKAIGEFKKILFNKMYGSKCIHEKALELGIRSELHTFNGQKHSLYLDENHNINDNFYTIQNEIVDFFYDELISYPAYIIQDNDDYQLFSIDTTNVVVSNWDVVGGISIEESKGKIRAIWFDDDTTQELRVSGYYTNGAGFEDVYVIKNIKQNEDNTHE